MRTGNMLVKDFDKKQFGRVSIIAVYDGHPSNIIRFVAVYSRNGKALLWTTDRWLDCLANFYDYSKAEIACRVIDAGYTHADFQNV